MRILTVTSEFPRGDDPDRGHLIHDRLRALRHLGAEVRVISPVTGPGTRSVPRQGEFDGFAVRHPRYYSIPVVGTRLLAFTYARGLRPVLDDEVTRFRPDVIDVHGLYPDGVATLSAAGHLEVPVSVTAHGRDVKVLARLPAVRKQISAALPKAAAVIATSQDLSQDLSGHRLFRGDVSIISNGIDPELFRPLPRAEARDELGLGQDARHLVYIGDLDSHQAVKLLLAAMGAKDVPDDFTVHFLGDGPTRRQLERLSRALGLGERAVFHGGVGRERLPLWLAAGNGSVHLGRAAGGSDAVRESLACGCPAMAADLPAMREVVRPWRDGLLVPLDIIGVARGLRKLLDTEWSVPVNTPRTWAEVAEEVLGLFSGLPTG